MNKMDAPVNSDSQRIANAKLASYQARSRKRKLRQNVSKLAIKRLARRGGVKRISSSIYNVINDVLRLYLENLLRDSIIICEYSKRKTVLAEDVVRAMKCRGQRLFGFDDKPFPISVRSSVRLEEDDGTSTGIPSIGTSESAPPSVASSTRSSSRLSGVPTTTMEESDPISFEVLDPQGSQSAYRSSPVVGSNKKSAIKVGKSSDKKDESPSTEDIQSRKNNSRAGESRNSKDFHSAHRFASRPKNNAELNKGKGSSSFESVESPTLRRKKSQINEKNDADEYNSDSTVENLEVLLNNYKCNGSIRTIGVPDAESVSRSSSRVISNKGWAEGKKESSARNTVAESHSIQSIQSTSRSFPRYRSNAESIVGRSNLKDRKAVSPNIQRKKSRIMEESDSDGYNSESILENPPSNRNVQSKLSASTVNSDDDDFDLITSPPKKK